ncbi:MAG: MmcQ-like protein [Verrucomicrobia bacterium]|nr:MmcQ-like protein [Verrucomicrobiota bacterium]|tara:strand:- start:3457 stop:3807 length:351 start_codon:yes stop_codon:yes gene_type:complete
MNVEDFREYCITKRGVSESFPFDAEVLVFKVMGKIFALANINDFQEVNLKCNPEKSIELRANYQGVMPGYHMNKKHWNTVSVRKDVPKNIIYQLIDESYNLVVSNLPKKLKQELNG